MTNEEFHSVIRKAVEAHGYNEVSRALGTSVPLISIHHWNAGMHLPVLPEDRQRYAGRLEVAFEVRTILAGIYTPILKHCGCTTEEVSSALDTIRQAYRAGVVDRDCFRALCEHAPLLTQLMAEYLCMPSAAYLRSYMLAWNFTYPLCTMAKVVGQWKP
jgi:tape measure domain-containing protein